MGLIGAGYQAYPDHRRVERVATVLNNFEELFWMILRLCRGEKVRVLDTGGATRENFRLATHQALVLAVLCFNGRPV